MAQDQTSVKAVEATPDVARLREWLEDLDSEGEHLMRYVTACRVVLTQKEFIAMCEKVSKVFGELSVKLKQLAAEEETR